MAQTVGVRHGRAVAEIEPRKVRRGRVHQGKTFRTQTSPGEANGGTRGGSLRGAALRCRTGARASPILDTVWSFGCMLYRNVKPRVAVRGRNDSEGVLAMIGLGNAWLDAKIDGVGWRATRHPLSRTCCVMTKPRST